MKVIAGFILFLLINSNCFGQDAQAGYTLSINFEPSFNPDSKLILHYLGSSASISLIIYKNHKDSIVDYRDSVIVNGDAFSALTNFLKTYQFKIKDNIDTIGQRRIFKNGDSVTVYDIEGGNDGITVKGKLNQNKRLRNFAFWSPRKGTENAKFMNIIFDLMEKSFKKDSTIDYIETLRDYFPHGLIVRKISENPLRYKWYGDINWYGNDNPSADLDAFLLTLPRHRRVFIDVSIAYITGIDYSNLEDYCARNKNIYWVNPRSRTLNELHDIDISRRHIIFTKKFENKKSLQTIK